jgi:putative tricarboxylic transport membrane protein
MPDGLILFGRAILTFLDPVTLAYVMGASLVGLIIGALPGLTATMGVALMTTLTLRMSPDQAITVLVCVYIGAIYGGSRSAILLNIPGTPANAAACLDGHALAKQGQAGRAIGISTTGSIMGTLIGIFFLALFTPILGDWALSFQSYEFFWLALFGVIISANLAGEDALKGWIAGFLGLFIAQIGQDGIHAFERFSFGYRDLAGGISLIPALVGAFGFAEVLSVMRERQQELIVQSIDSVWPRWRDVIQYWRTIIRSGLIGTGIGIIPGVGEDIAAWASYAAAKRASKEPEKFGKGSIEGLMAAETGDNACPPGAVIPALSLGVPGSAPAAVLLAAMIIHGIRPGPLIMVENPQFVYEVVVMMMLATFGIFFYGIFLVRPLLTVLRFPRTIIMPVVFVLCTVGTYAIAQRMFDVYVMIVFGIIGFVLRERGYPMAPLVLGIVLGDLLDKNLRRGLVLTDGDLTPFFTRPISLIMIAMILLTVVLRVPAVTAAFARIKARAAGGAG